MSSGSYSVEPVTVNRARATQPWVRYSTDYVRCFCNLPQCVSTGYMCKSSGGGCFSNFLDHFGHHSRDYRGRHGCLELLSDKEHRSFCENSPEKNASSQNHQEPNKSLIFCCYHDMCNHLDSPQTKNLMNRTLPVNELKRETVPENHIQDHRTLDYTNSQIWFRAATIAVPVCGAVILFVLIALAVKILRSENQNSPTRKLGPPPTIYEPNCDKSPSYHILRKSNPMAVESHSKNHYDLEEDLQRIQVPLLIQKNEIAPIHHRDRLSSVKNKNETNAKLNLIHEDPVCNSNDYNKGSIFLDIEKNVPLCSEVNLVRGTDSIAENRKFSDKFANNNI